MKKLTKKSMSMLVALVFVLTAVIASVNVFAANTVEKTLVPKKVLTKAEAGVTTPDVTFNFTAEKHSFDGKEAEKDTLPDLTASTIAYTAADDTDADAAKDGKQLTKAASDMLDNVKFEKAGQYTYTIKETEGTEKGVTYSKAEYLASLFVVKKDGKFVVNNIMIKKIKNDDGTDATGEKTPYDPTDLDKNGLAFNNVYDKKDGNPDPGKNDPDPDTPNPDDKKGLVINKIVAADENSGESFGFKLTLTAPKGATKAAVDAVPTAKIVDKDGKATPVTINAYGTATEFQLKAGEKLVLNDVLLGSTAMIEETESQGFNPSVKAMAAGGEVTALDTLNTTGIVLGDQQGGNSAAFTNTKQTATGVILKNLPFIILGLVATAGIVLYVRGRAKKVTE